MTFRLGLNWTIMKGSCMEKVERLYLYVQRRPRRHRSDDECGWVRSGRKSLCSGSHGHALWQRYEPPPGRTELAGTRSFPIQRACLPGRLCHDGAEPVTPRWKNSTPCASWAHAFKAILRANPPGGSKFPWLGQGLSVANGFALSVSNQKTHPGLLLKASHELQEGSSRSGKP